VVPPAITGAITGYFLARALNPADERWLRVADNMGLGLGAALACILLVWLGGHKVSTIGLTTRNLRVDFGIGVSSMFGVWVMLFMISLYLVLLFPSLMEQPSKAQKAIEASFPRLSLVQMTLLCLCIAVYEEIVFRGFLLTRLYAIFRRWWLAVLIGASLFGSLHLYQGAIAVGMVTLLGLVMGAIFAWRRSLTSPIIMHFMYNLIMFAMLGSISKTWK